MDTETTDIFSETYQCKILQVKERLVEKLHKVLINLLF